MELTDNQYITTSIARQLAKDGWTMETLATTYPPVLAEYRGIGKFKAQGIVKEAQRLVSEQKLKEADPRNNNEPMSQTEEPPAMSVRLRRLREQNANRT